MVGMGMGHMGSATNIFNFFFVVGKVMHDMMSLGKGRRFVFLFFM
jgi:hypothetical protein